MTTKHTNWRLQGSYFETCNCMTSCPCVWHQPPSEGDCKLLAAWHIDSGHFDETRLDGINVALACYAPELMINGRWKAALYLDETANQQQTDALTLIFSGQAGGHLKVLMSFVEEVWGIKKVAMVYGEENELRSLVIPGIAEAEIQSIHGISGNRAYIENPPLCVVPSHPSIVAKSNHYQYEDYGQSWLFSNRNGFHSEFVYQP